ncbi:choice-of-anchor D domain-containing protein [Methylotenera versatilis]|uniref:Uncharacterized protein n=1 Tax=Methylotenera versatilis (strain 301) TaxID=666681 RepID=D7DME6_METV0|nr:choice-of-anchor D domain-containing protein [Methylotenera versatilis]ADI28857.1 hypothetical protein M301_0473 [Methylotenera versatilis 301]
MRAYNCKTSLIKSGLAAFILLLASSAALAATINLTAAPTQTKLPDGQTVPMWGYRCGTVDANAASATCAASNPAAGNNWSPVVITVPANAAGGLTINLTNNLSFATGSGTNTVPTSLVIVGQLGGGLGSAPARMPSPTHAAQGTTWPGTLGAPDPTACLPGADPAAAAAAGTFCPPAQAARVRSFGTEVAAGSSQVLTWSSLRPGTYLIESGTQPSIQGPMGLYGMLVVTDATYPGQAFDKDVPLLLSEIDQLQNTAVDTAVKTAGFSDGLVWNGQAGQCGDQSVHTCYPPAVNYDPRYYLINGVSFDRTNIGSSTFAGPAATVASGNVLLRFVNAGLRMHVPSVVNANMTLLAEDGNKLPGVPKVQSELLLPAGKTYDVTIQPTHSSGSYVPATYALFDRALSLSTNNQRDGGMQAYIAINGGAASGVGTNSPGGSSTTLSAVDKNYYCISGSTLAVSDPNKGVLAGVVGANGATLADSSALPVGATLAFQSDGTFTYTPPTTGTCAGAFSYLVNGTLSKTATITQCDASTPGCAALGGAPVANSDAYTSAIATQIKVASPGVLLNDTDPSGLPLKTAIVGTPAGGTVILNADGSFTATPTTAPTTAPVNVTFQYNAINTQNTVSTGPATVTLTFPTPSNLAVNVKDAKTGVAINDYRWIIEEDRTFWIDPKCQVNTGTGQRPDGCPPLPVESLGYNFHTANMPVIATGCVGDVSCEIGQAQQGTPVACDVGNGVCRTDAGKKIAVLPSQVALDPSKRYYISVLPGDGINTTLGGAGGPQNIGGKDVPFDIARDCGPFSGPTGAWEPGGPSALCGHAMGGAQISKEQVQQAAAGAGAPVNISLQQTPLPTAKISVFVFQDDNPLNGENDAGGGVDVIAPNEPGLSGFEIKLFDQAGGLGDATGQITYDMFNMPVSNSLAGTKDPVTGLDACPISTKSDGLVGMVPTCPKFESDGKTLSPLAGQVVVANLYPGLYEIVATPGHDRIARGEEWLQTNTLDGGKAHEAFIKPNEPGYFQEFGPGGYHVAIGFANPKIINNRKAAYCASLDCSHTLNVSVANTHMSRTPDQRTFSTHSYDHYGFTTCYVSVGPADTEDFAFQKCDADGKVTFTGMPNGTYKLTVFDQWNDIMLDGLVSTVVVNGDTTKEFPVTQWRTNLYTRTFIDTNGDGVSQEDEPGLPLVSTNIRYRDGSFGFFNSTDLKGYAGFNEVFPFMNWLVVDSYTTSYKSTATHVVYDAGGPVDGQDGGGSSTIAANLANTIENNSLPPALRVPGARYCASADCPAGDTAGGSTGRVDPAGTTTEGWQGLLGQNTFIEFAKKPFAKTENGGIMGHVIYASTRPFDDPALLLQLSWEPGVPRVQINLYQEGTAADGSKTLKLVDTTKTTSFDDWAQGFRSDGVPNMNCPGQDASSPFFATLKDSKMWLDPTKTALPNNSQFKCYDGWSQLNQAQPAPYDGLYKFPSVTSIDLATGLPTGTNCSICVNNPSGDGTKMLPAGKYVVEVIVPTGYELVKEEDKNILMGDVYVAPVTQQFAGLGSIFIMPDQAAVNAYYNKNNLIQSTTNNGAVPRHEGDTGTVEAFWACVGEKRIVPDFNSLFPGAGQAAPFAGALRPLCDRKEVILEDEMTALAKFYVFTSTHIAGHFTGMMTNDFASEFDPFSPQFGEKFGPPNLPVGLRDFNGNEVARVYSDQWGVYNGLFFSSYGVNPPNPTGYVPQMAIACMNDPGPIHSDPLNPNSPMITDPSYNPAYSNFCYETPFMPGFTAYMDTPVIPTQAFADGYNLPDTEYPDGTPAIKAVMGDGIGPWVAAAAGSRVVSSITLNSAGSGYSSAPTVTISGGGGSGAQAISTLTPSPIGALNLTNGGNGYALAPTVTFAGGGSGASAIANMGVGSVAVTSANGSYRGITTPVVTFSAPPCAINGTTCVLARGTATMSSNQLLNLNRRVTGISLTGGTNTRGSGYTSPPTVTFSTGPATATTSLNIRSLQLVSGGSGYVLPTVGFTGGGGNGATATATVSGASVASVILLTGGSGYAGIPTIGFTGGSGSGASATAATAASGNLTITALGAKQVQNPNYSGPNATSAPYNQKTIIRHYDFGSSAGSVALVGNDGVARPLTGVTWSNDTITGTVPNGLPNCTVQQRNQPASKCGQLVITRSDNGKQSIDAITVTVGGSSPWFVTEQGVTAPGGKSVKDYTANFGRFGFSPIQTALDSAEPGDLVIVGPGTYRENLIMWKPVRLQGVGAGSVTVNADAHPAGKMDQWRRQVDCVFGLTLSGVPNLGNSSAAFDPNGQYSCPSAMHQRGDRIPFEAITGWDASGNGNLAQVLQEPTLMGAYEGAGITVLGRGVRIPNGSTDFWGAADPTAAGAFPSGSQWLSGGNNDCRADSTLTNGLDYGTSNYYCNPSRIDGLSVLNSSQGGGGLFVHGWGHNLEIANTRISGNHGTLAGAINLGNGETPPVFVNDGVICGAGAAGDACPPLNGTPVGATIPFAFDVNVRIHHNMLYNNASIGDALFTGTPAGAGGVTVSAGGDNYQIDHNWIAGNLSTGDGGGLQTLGVSFNGKINNNYILFNQSTNPTLPTNGGGVVIQGANEPRTFQGAECGGTTDHDCPPGLGDGTGAGLVIDANLILGNSAESGSGGGLRLQQVNGSEMIAFPTNNTRWYGVTVTNNIIANNVAGWDGGGVSIEDALKVNFTNNTVVSNDTTASAGSLFKTLGAINASSPPPGCTPTTDPNAPQNPNCLGVDAPHGPQPAGLVVMANTINLRDAIAGLANQNVSCPTIQTVANLASIVRVSGTVTVTTATPVTLHVGDIISIAVNNGGGNFNGTKTVASTPDSTHFTYLQGSGNTAQINNRGTVTYNSGNPYPVASGVNATCKKVSLPIMTNNIIWQNRSFSVDIVSPGTGLQSQQNLVALAPQLNQTATGECAQGASYWDFGLRTDDVAGGTIPSGTKLTLNNSIYTNDVRNVNVVSSISANNHVGGSSPVIAQFCNGARTAPEGCNQLASGLGQSCHGFNVPPGSSETTGLADVFVFSGIRPTATVDEGHNWLNLSYGPLTLSRPNVSTATAAEQMVASADIGTKNGAYSIPSTSVAVDNGNTNGAPSRDFYGNTRVGVPDIGAVEVIPAAIASVTGGPLTFSNVAVGSTSAAQTLTLQNTGGGSLTGIGVAVTSPFSRAGGTCGATLAASSSCTITVTFTPTGTAAATGTVTITGSVPVTGSPVALNGTGVAPVTSATLAPASWTVSQVRNCPGTGLGQLACALDPSQSFTLTNTGNVTLTGITTGSLSSSPVANAANYAIIGTVLGVQQSTCGTTVTSLAPGATCTVRVQFKPLTAQAAGAKPATLSVTAGAAGLKTSSLNGTAN